jgi:predicted permease
MRWFGRPDRDYREELAEHIEIETRENVERGMPPEGARRAAERKFGNALAVRETLADERPMTFFGDLARDLRHAFRMLRRSPGLTVGVTLTLALGIGANTAIFSLVNAVLLRMLPVRNPQELVAVRALMRTGKPDWFSQPDYEWLRDHNKVFSNLAASINGEALRDDNGEKTKTNFFLVSGNYFPMLGVAPAAGRLLTHDDDEQRHAVAVLSYDFWQRAYGGRASALGAQIHMVKATSKGDLPASTLEIVGVAPRGFHGEYDYGAEYYPEFFTPLSLQPDLEAGQSLLHRRNVSWLGALGRLRPGVTLAQAQAAAKPMLEGLRDDLNVDRQNDYLGGIGIEPGGKGLSGARERYGEALQLLMGLVAVVLLIGCANVANLLLARSAARRREFAVRLAVGAGRTRLLRQLLTESLLLSAIACLAGLAIAQGIDEAVLAMTNTNGPNFTYEHNDLHLHMDLSVLAFAVLVSCASAICFGLAPALASNRIDPWTALKESRIGGGRGAGWVSHGWLNHGWLNKTLSPTRIFVILQTTLSMVLLVACGLLLRTFLNLKTVNPGFDEQVLQVNIDRSLASNRGPALGDRIRERVSTLPGVLAVSYSRFGPILGTSRQCCVAPEGYTPTLNEDKNVRVQQVSSGYFAAVGIPLIGGRDFAARDSYSAPEVIVVNETFARRYFGAANPVGKHLGWSNNGPKDTEIIGVARDAKYDDLRQETPRLVYFSTAQRAQGPNFIEVRIAPGAGRPVTALDADLRAAIRAVDPKVRIGSIRPLADVISAGLSPERLVTWLAAGFGFLALLLTSLGLYGVLAYTVARRTSEFGIRMALGAGRGSILKMVAGESFALVGVGLLLGLAAAVSLSRFIAGLLFGVEPNDAMAFAAAGVVLSVVAALATFGPARRATAIPPATALRCE